MTVPNATTNTARHEPTARGALDVAPTVDSEITWLLHRAAQRMRSAVGEQAEHHGMTLRDHIVLSALHKTPGLTQIELGKALGIDKSTLMTQLDRLEQAGHIERHSAPGDRRARIPHITAAGDRIRSRVASASHQEETAALRGFNDEQVTLFRRMLFEIIGDSNDPGSCL
jgi:DNA-binding MarR family transcriptional regulator